MELYKEIYFRIKHDVKTDLTNEEIVRILDNKCYTALCEIRNILRNRNMMTMNVLIKSKK